MMRTAFDRRRLTITRMLNRDRRGALRGAPRGVLPPFPSVKGLLGKSLRGERPRPSAELAELCINEAKVAVVPGEAFGAPGFFRMSYALGDDDLVEGGLPFGQLLRRSARLKPDRHRTGSAAVRSTTSFGG